MMIVDCAVSSFTFFLLKGFWIKAARQLKAGANLSAQVPNPVGESNDFTVFLDVYRRKP